MLTIIEDLGMIKDSGGTTRRWCNVKCSYCNKIVKRRTQQIKHHESCGCATFLKANKTHGMSKTRQYQIWADMKSRCNNKHNSNYNKYGGRGILYDKKWSTFEGFWNDMSEGYIDDLTIDRIDSNKNYYKNNCRWVTIEMQQTNSTNNTIGTFKKHKLNNMFNDITFLKKLKKEYRIANRKNKKIIRDKLILEYKCSDRTARNKLNKG